MKRSKITTNALLFFMATSAVSMTLIPSASAAADFQVIITDSSTNQQCEEQDSCFSKSGLIIDQGQIVTWKNEDYAMHTIQSGSDEFGSNGLFSSQIIMPGESFSHTFSESGLYNYYCPSHPWMKGAILVK